MRIKKWDYIRDRYYMVEIPKTGPEPEEWGIAPPILPAVEERYPDFEQQTKLRAEQKYSQYIRRMKQLGLIESNPGNVQEVWASQFQRIGGWWQTLLGWIEGIDKYIGPLIDLYAALEEAGIITSGQREQAEAEGWTKEQLVSLIRAQMAPAWQTYLPWIAAGGLGIGLILVLALRRPAPVYVAK